MADLSEGNCISSNIVLKFYCLCQFCERDICYVLKGSRCISLGKKQFDGFIHPYFVGRNPEVEFMKWVIREQKSNFLDRR